MGVAQRCPASIVLNIGVADTHVFTFETSLLYFYCRLLDSSSSIGCGLQLHSFVVLGVKRRDGMNSVSLSNRSSSHFVLSAIGWRQLEVVGGPHCLIFTIDHYFYLNHIRTMHLLRRSLR